RRSGRGASGRPIAGANVPGGGRGAGAQGRQAAGYADAVAGPGGASADFSDAGTDEVIDCGADDEGSATQEPRGAATGDGGKAVGHRSRGEARPGAAAAGGDAGIQAGAGDSRSEEHTSELQS